MRRPLALHNCRGSIIRRQRARGEQGSCCPTHCYLEPSYDGTHRLMLRLRALLRYNGMWPTLLCRSRSPLPPLPLPPPLVPMEGYPLHALKLDGNKEGSSQVSRYVRILLRGNHTRTEMFPKYYTTHCSELEFNRG